MGLFSKIASFFSRKDKNNVSAIILCAGESTRFSNDGKSKQMEIINGSTVVERTIRAFDNTKAIGEIIIVVRKEDADEYKTFIEEGKFSKVKCIVTGGETRQISALRGFKHIDEHSQYVAIHDGARCLITSEIIEKVLNEAKEFGAATAATKVYDTIKVADSDGFIKKTLDRTYIWTVQTPQIFNIEAYNDALQKARADQISVTDDCMLLENAGYKVKLVETGAENIKITIKDDIKRAQSILLARGEN
jgi:2-C-methyl-D-erythritol 4-phosphate cytidylyltransferase